MDEDNRRKLIELRDYLVGEIKEWKSVAREESMFGGINADGKADVLANARDKFYLLFPEVRD